MGQLDLSDLDDDDAVYGDQEKGADRQLLPLFYLVLNVVALRCVIGVQTFLEGEVLDVDVHRQQVEDLGQEENFYEVWEQDGDYCWDQLGSVKEGFLGSSQTEYSALH